MSHHFDDIISTFQRYRNDGFLCDTVLIPGRGEMINEHRAHSALLAASSPVFRAVFAENASNCWRRIEIPDVNNEILQIFLDFIYSGKLLLPESYANVQQLSGLVVMLTELGLSRDQLTECDVIFRDGSGCDLFSVKAALIYNLDSTISLSYYTTEETCLVSTDRNHCISIQPISAHNETPIESSLLDHSVVTDSIKIRHTPEKNSIFIDRSKRDDTLRADNRNAIKNDPEFRSTNLGLCTKDTENAEKNTQSMCDDKLLCSVNRCNQSMSTSSPDTIVAAKEDYLPNHETDDGECACDLSYACEQCGEMFPKLPQLVKHALLHNGGLKQYRCSTCGKIFSQAWNLARHERSHAGDPNDYLCHLCGRSYSQKGTLIDHMDVHYGRSHSCDLCSRKFVKGSYLRQHLRLYHNQTSLDKSVAQRSSLIKTVKIDSKFICRMCGKCFGSVNKLSQHKKTHEKPFACPMCMRQFVTEAQLAQHLHTHTAERPFACDKCDKSYKRKQQLVWHEGQHEEVEGDSERARPYKCDTCGKTFTYTTSLHVHLRTHTGFKPYVCSVCGQSYLQSNHLRVHMRVHSGERPFSCDYCAKTYKNRLDLRLHCSRIHQVDISKWRVVNNRKVPAMSPEFAHVEKITEG